MHAFSFLVLALTMTFFSSLAASEPATPETIQRGSGESEEKFLIRKQRITYGTPLNRELCSVDIAINVGLCKGGDQSSCFYRDMYKSWCVAPGQDKDAALEKLPALNREVYFDNLLHPAGKWLSRTEYCRGLLTHEYGEFRSRRGRATSDAYAKNCK